MNDDVFIQIVYSGLKEILKDQSLYSYYGASIGFSKLTLLGEKAVIDYINLVGHNIRTKDKHDLEELAKRITWENVSK